MSLSFARAVPFLLGLALAGCATGRDMAVTGKDLGPAVAEPARSAQGIAPLD